VEVELSLFRFKFLKFETFILGVFAKSTFSPPLPDLTKIDLAPFLPDFLRLRVAYGQSLTAYLLARPRYSPVSFTAFFLFFFSLPYFCREKVFSLPDNLAIFF